MKTGLLLLAALGWPVIASGQTTSPEISRDAFRDPPFVYRPIATLSDHGVSANVMDQVKAAFQTRGYGSVLFSPSPDSVAAPRSAAPANGLPSNPSGGGGRRPSALQYTYPPEASKWLFKALPGEAGIGSYMIAPKASDFPGAAQMLPIPNDPPDATLGYMKDAYFARAGEILAYARQYGRKATYYDEVGFPSGMADHTTPPQYVRKALARSVSTAAGGSDYQATMPVGEIVVSVVAANPATKQRIDLLPLIRDGRLAWTAPAGDWTVETIAVKPEKSSGRTVDYNGAVDYMDPEAVSWFIAHAYEPMAQHLGTYFGNTLNMTFFDDVGIYSDDKTWSLQVSARFKAMTGRDASLYYPALWSDIGPDTEAARSALFGARASLLGEGLPKLVTEWDDRHGVEASGHMPGNYDLQPVDMNGDPFKFSRYEKVPMVDVIFGHGFGRGGYKLISSAADEWDKPLVAAESFSSGGDIMGYRRLIELYVRGINRFVTSAFPRTQPVGAPQDFAEWSGRSSLLLQGGRHVADIAILYPIDALEAFYSFEARGNTTALPAGSYISEDTDYQAVGEMLLDQAHRDFTFLDPETVGSAKVSVNPGTLVLNNQVNRQSYKALILPGAKVLSVAALAKVKQFYDAGGVVIATSLLASKSAEFDRDAEIRSMIQAIFGIDSILPMPDGVSTMRSNAKGGKAIFLRAPTSELLESTLEKAGVTRDVTFARNPTPTAGNGCFSYIHKVKEGAQIYYFGNSSDTPIATSVEVRGRLKPEFWDPKSGTVIAATGVSYQQKQGVTYTEIPLNISPVSAMFIVGR